MKAVGLVVLALAEIGTGSATGERVSAAKVIAAPKSYVGRKIVLPNIACVDVPKDRLTCIQTVGGETLRLEASVLGAKTRLDITERLIGECKGLENLTRASCRVDAEIEPATGYKSNLDVDGNGKPIAVLVSGQIEMYPIKRR